MFSLIVYNKFKADYETFIYIRYLEVTKYHRE
jgi:hypothetical protein